MRKQVLHSFIGGNLMGFGASLAGGCSIGNGLVMTAMMTWQGWVVISIYHFGNMDSILFCVRTTTFEKEKSFCKAENKSTTA